MWQTLLSPILAQPFVINFAVRLVSQGRSTSTTATPTIAVSQHTSWQGTRSLLLEADSREKFTEPFTEVLLDSGCYGAARLVPAGVRRTPSCKPFTEH